jgi:hypothetical protein
MVKTILDHLPEGDVLVQKLGIVPLGEPAGTPILGVTEPKSYGMDLLTHFNPLSLPASQ